MATYSRTTNTPATQTSQSLPAVRTSGSAQMGSMELGEIIVRSLETVQESLGRDEVPVGYEQIEKAVTTGINKSILGKQNKGNLAATKNGIVAQTGSASDKALAQYWEQKKYQDWKKEQERQKKLDDEERKRREENWNKKVDEAFKNINSFSQNPLKGLSDALDKGVKGLFKSVGNVMNKSLGEIGGDIKKGAGTVKDNALLMGKLLTSPLRGVGNAAIYGAAGISAIKDRMKSGSSSGSSSSSDIGSLISDESEEKIATVSSSGGSGDAIKDAKAKSEMASLIDENEEDEKEKEKTQEEQTEKLGELTKGQEKQMKQSDLKLGVVIGGIAALAAAIPAAAGVILPFINNIPYYREELKVKFGLLFNGPNSIGKQIKISLQETLANLAESDNPVIAALGKPFAYGASEETTNAKNKAGDALKDVLLNMGANEEEVDKYISTYGKDGLSGIQNILDSKYINSLSKSKLNKYNKFKKSLSKDDKNKLSEKLDSKQWKEITDEDIQWMYDNFVTSGKMSLDDFENFKDYVNYARVIDDWNVAAKAWDEDKSSKINFEDMRKANADESERKYNEKMADVLKKKLENGEVSTADLQTYSGFRDNEVLMADIKENPKLLSNLRENSYWENLAVGGQEYINPWETMLKNLWNNTFKQTIEANRSNTNVIVNDSAKSAL